MRVMSMAPLAKCKTLRPQATPQQIENGRVGAIVADLKARGLLGMVDEVCVARVVLRNEVLGTCRFMAATEARAEVFWRLRHWPARRYSYREIARLMRRDESNVWTAVQRHEARLSHMPDGDEG